MILNNCFGHLYLSETRLSGLPLLKNKGLAVQFCL